MVMQTSTKEERAAKFAAKPRTYGRRSRGHRKSTFDEQKDLYHSLDKHPSAARLENLKILREAILSSDDGSDSKKLEMDIYAKSIRESIELEMHSVVQPLLSHITRLSNEKLWSRLFVVSLANSGEFAEAYKACQNTEDWEYVTCLATEDEPLREKLLSDEESELVVKLMRQLDSVFKTQHEKLKIAFEHPKNQRLSNTAARGGN